MLPVPLIKTIGNSCVTEKPDLTLPVVTYVASPVMSAYMVNSTSENTRTQQVKHVSPSHNDCLPLFVKRKKKVRVTRNKTPTPNIPRASAPVLLCGHGNRRLPGNLSLLSPFSHFPTGFARFTQAGRCVATLLCQKNWTIPMWNLRKGNGHTLPADKLGRKNTQLLLVFASCHYREERM